MDGWIWGNLMSIMLFFSPLDFTVKGTRYNWEPHWGLLQLSLPASRTRPASLDAPGCRATRLSYYSLNRPREVFIIGIRDTWANLENNSWGEWTKEKMYYTPYRDVLCTLKSNLRTFGPFPCSLRKKSLSLDSTYSF